MKYISNAFSPKMLNPNTDPSFKMEPCTYEEIQEEKDELIRSRYFEDLTQQEVARKLNMTQVMVSRYEKKSINKMRDYLTL